jgi:hypothetical protein
MDHLNVVGGSGRSGRAARAHARTQPSLRFAAGGAPCSSSQRSSWGWGVRPCPELARMAEKHTDSPPLPPADSSAGSC